MSPQQHAAWKIERIVFCACRVILWNIQGREVVIIVFDFRPGSHTESGVPKDFFDAGHGPRYRMSPAKTVTPSGKCDIDGIIDKSLG